MHRRALGKLEAAAAAFYETIPEIAEGFTREDYESDPVDVWPENWPVVQLFLRLATQWRVGGMGSKTGLDYLVVYATLDKLKLTENECEHYFADIQVLEIAALKEMNKGSGDEQR